MFNNKVQRFSIRKLTVGAASVLIGVAFLGGANAVHADTNNAQTVAVQKNDGKHAVKISYWDDTNNKPLNVNSEINGRFPEGTVVLSQSRIDIHNYKLVNEGDLAKNFQMNAAGPGTIVVGDKDADVVLHYVSTEAKKNESNEKPADTTKNNESKPAENKTNTNTTTQNKDTKHKVTVRFINDYTGKAVYKLNRSKVVYEYVNPISGEFKDGEAIEVHETKLNSEGKQYTTTYSVNEYYNIPGFVLLNKDEFDKAFPKANKWGEPVMSADKDIDFTLHYAPLADTLVKYVDADTGNTIAHMTFTNKSLNVASKTDPAANYEAVAINIPGYKLISAPAIEGKIQNDQIKTKGNDNPTVLVFKYKKVTPNQLPQDIASHQNNGGIKISDAKWSAIPGTFIITRDDKTGGSITTDGRSVEKAHQELIDRYTKQGYTYAGTSGLVYDAEPYDNISDATHTHLVPNKPVTVNYVDEDGKALAPQDTIAFNKNNPDQKNNGIDEKNYWYPEGEWTTKPKDIKGYDLVKTFGAENGKFTTFAYSVTYVYKKHVDQPTNPSTPDNPTNPTTPSTPTETVVPKPQEPEVPTTPEPNEPETVRPHASEEPKVEKKAVKKAKVVKTAETVKPHAAKIAKAEAVKAQLPQTGEHESAASIIGLAMVSALSFLGLASKKRKN